MSSIGTEKEADETGRMVAALASLFECFVDHRTVVEESEPELHAKREKSLRVDPTEG